MTRNSFQTLTGWKHAFLYLLFGASTISIAMTDSAMTLLYVLVLIQIARQREFWGFRAPLVLALGGFLALNLLSGAVVPYQTGVLKALDLNLRLFLPLVMLYALEGEQELVPRLLHVFLIGLVLMALYGIVQYFTGIDLFRVKNTATPYKHPCYSLYGYTHVFHAKGNYTHHLTFGGVMLLGLALYSSLCFCREFSRLKRWLYAGGAGILSLAIVASLGRSIWIGSGIALAVLCLRLPRRWLLGLLAGMLMVSSALVTHYTLRSPKLDEPVSGLELVWQRLASGFIPKYNQDRLLLWESAWAAIQDHPWLGIGLKNDAEVMPRYRAPITARTGHQFFNSAGAGVHNIYLQTWVNLGIVGLIGYLTLWGVFLQQTITFLRRRAGAYDLWTCLTWGTLAGSCGFLGAGFFENNFRDAEVQTIVMMLFGLFLSAQHHESQASHASRR